MYIASRKHKENIAEYLLYMWQIEDIIRAYNLDIDHIEESVIRPMGLDEERAHALREWYVSLIDMMRCEGVERSGHLQINRNTLGQLVDLHRRLLSSDKYAEYSAQLYKTLPFIVELRAEGWEGSGRRVGDVFQCAVRGADAKAARPGDFQRHG